MDYCTVHKPGVSGIQLYVLNTDFHMENIVHEAFLDFFFFGQVSELSRFAFQSKSFNASAHGLWSWRRWWRSRHQKGFVVKKQRLLQMTDRGAWETLLAAAFLLSVLCFRGWNCICFFHFTNAGDRVQSRSKPKLLLLGQLLEIALGQSEIYLRYIYLVIHMTTWYSSHKPEPGLCSGFKFFYWLACLSCDTSNKTVSQGSWSFWKTITTCSCWGEDSFSLWGAC